jgi:carbamoyltransferase
MRVLGVNAIFHDPAAALVVDGVTVAAADEERFSRRKHGKRPVAFSAWELPEQAMRWCLSVAGLEPADLDAVAYSFDPALATGNVDDPWEWLRRMYAERFPGFCASALPGLDPAIVRFVPHHVAHAASAGLAAPFGGDAAVLVLDGRGERASHLAGHYRGGVLEPLASTDLPSSLGLLYEDVTQHLGFLRSSDEYKVMALASYGQPRHLDLLRQAIRTTGDGRYVTEAVDWSALAKPRGAAEEWTADHADLAASVQRRLEEVLVDLASWLRAETGATGLAMAGGVALNCVANTVIAERAGFDEVWVQPAAGDAGTALGAALHVWQQAAGQVPPPFPGADLGRGFTDAEIEAVLRAARVPYERPADLPELAAQVLAGDGLVAWYDGRSEWGPRALGHRSLLANPARQENLARMNDVKGREQFRPVAPMVLAERAAEVFGRGPVPSPYMLFVHDVRPQWRDRIPAVVHVDGTARIQTVDDAGNPKLAAMLRAFERRTGLPVVVNTSLNTAGRPMVDTPREALEIFGSAPVDLLAVGPFAVRRGALA